MNKNRLTDNRMKESFSTQKLSNKIYPRDSEAKTNSGFVKIDNRKQGSTQWNCFNVKDIHFFKYLLISFHSNKYQN